MSGSGELALLGVVLLVLGLGICVLSVIGIIDQKIVDLPLGPAEGEVAKTTRSNWANPVSGLAMALLGVVLVALGGAHPPRKKGGKRDR